ncbi:aspartyl-phosphate phosphatase Spo0E family protein [Halobacillus campisalis]|uniref:Aspartyl-phosphate phosphatase Spo0E family protein n=1 Tax=Halobacillus campisalis TaxID=435909 RepID=A0ABW2JZA4_9BACI
MEMARLELYQDYQEGKSDEEVIEISQKLDKLLNQYIQYNKNFPE